MKRALGALAALAALGAVCIVGFGFSAAAFTARSANVANTFTAAASFCTAPGTQTLTADRDTYVDQQSATAINGTAATLRITSRSAKNERTLVGFTLPAVPTGCSVTAATLKLTASSAAASRTLEAYQSGGTWSEAATNWNNKPSTTGSAATTSSGTGLRQWTVTSQVQAMYAGTNNGFLLKDATEEAGGGGSTQVFSSREATSNRPQLTVTFG